MTESAFAVRPIGDEVLPMGVLPYARDADDDNLLMVMSGAARFGEATFEQSIRQLSSGGSLASAFLLPAAPFVTASAAIARGDASFIYHVGRCGSTLLARMLAVDPRLCVFSEPAAWAQLQQVGTSRPEEHPDAAGASDGCMRLFSRFASDRGQRLVVKPSSWQVLHARALRDACESSLEVFLFRSPAAVVASNLNVPPGFLQVIELDREAPASVLDGWLPGVDRALLNDPVDLYAELWRVVVDAVLESLDGVLLVSYDELQADPATVVARVAQHFGMADFPVDRAVHQASFYSKSATRTERFDPAGTHQRATLTADEQTRVAFITADAEARLMAAWAAQRGDA
jgi:hypothetical protein